MTRSFEYRVEPNEYPFVRFVLTALVGDSSESRLSASADAAVGRSVGVTRVALVELPR